MENGIGNDRLFQAVQALATVEGDVRSRVCIAMRIISPINEREFSSNPALWSRICKLKIETSQRGPQKINGEIVKDSYEYTANNRKNRTYTRYAKEIMDLWLETGRFFT
jgi:hypothetical protein